jgi:hypothetical protein
MPPVPLETEDDFFFMSNLPPSFTGLPFLVWISQRGFARHDIRVKVTRSHKVKPGEFITVSVRPTVKVLRGELRPAELKLLCKWIKLNQETLIKFWEGDIETTPAVLEQLKPLQ